MGAGSIQRTAAAAPNTSMTGSQYIARIRKMSLGPKMTGGADRLPVRLYAQRRAW
jgi:hypothetical protein